MPTLRVQDPGGRETVLVLDGQDVCFGRAVENGLVLDARGVSRRHGRFYRNSQDRWCVEDLGSTNGILLQGRPAQRQVLRDGDALSIGSATVIFNEDGGQRRPASAAVTIT